MNIFKNCLSYLLLTSVLGAAILAPMTFATSESPNWMSSNVTVESTRDSSASADCEYESIKHVVENPWQHGGQSVVDEWACVGNGKDVDIAFNPYGEQYVRFHGDSTFRLLYAESILRIEDNSNFASYIRNTSDYRLVTINDLATSLEVTKTDGLGGVVAYGVRANALTSQFPLSTQVGAYHKVFSFQITPDLHYLSAYIDYAGVVKLDLRTGQVTKLTTFPGSSLYHAYIPNVEAISDDGRYILLGNSIDIIDTEGCGELLVGEYRSDIPLVNPCPYQNFSQQVLSYGPPSHRVNKAKFIDDNYGVIFLETAWGSQPGGADGTSSWVTIHAAGYDPDHVRHLVYLALGDSYSSGEGDIDDDLLGDWYISGTEGEGQCHVSVRSYPFVLRDLWNIKDSDMKSVACSGAKVSPDYYGTGLYYGQDGQYKGLNADQLRGVNKEVLEQFTPGTVRQIDFVKEYKPEIVTFTGGGNDVGFADILGYCATPGITHEDDVCAYARDDDMRKSLNHTIDKQYTKNREFIEEIKRVSPSTKIYMIGYPQFIADYGLCSDLSSLLNLEERQMIRESVSRLNNILKKVARDTGIYFVDIEDSLSGGEICQGSKYMSGPIKVGVSRVSAKDSNMYHPNNKGHTVMAEAINKKIKSGMDYEIIDIPEQNDGSEIIHMAVMPDYTGVGSTNTVEMNSGMFKPDGTVTMELFSQRRLLGVGTAGSDGSFKKDITIPSDISPGIHLISISGLNMNSEPISIQQYINIEDSEEDPVENIVVDNCDLKGPKLCDAWYQSLDKEVVKPVALSYANLNQDGRSNNDYDTFPFNNRSGVMDVAKSPAASKGMDSEKRDHTLLWITLSIGSIILVGLYILCKRKKLW